MCYSVTFLNNVLLLGIRKSLLRSSFWIINEIHSIVFHYITSCILLNTHTHSHTDTTYSYTVAVPRLSCKWVLTIVKFKNMMKVYRFAFTKVTGEKVPLLLDSYTQYTKQYFPNDSWDFMGHPEVRPWSPGFEPLQTGEELWRRNIYISIPCTFPRQLVQCLTQEWLFKWYC